MANKNSMRRQRAERPAIVAQKQARRAAKKAQAEKS